MASLSVSAVQGQREGDSAVAELAWTDAGRPGKERDQERGEEDEPMELRGKAGYVSQVNVIITDVNLVNGLSAAAALHLINARGDDAITRQRMAEPHIWGGGGGGLSKTQLKYNKTSAVAKQCQHFNQEHLPGSTELGAPRNPNVLLVMSLLVSHAGGPLSPTVRCAKGQIFS